MNKTFIKTVGFLFMITGLFGFSGLPAVQAAEKTVEQEILDILKDKDVIPQSQYDELSKKATMEGKKSDHLFSAKGWNLDIGGTLELEYLVPDDDTGISNKNARFQLDKIVLTPKISSDSNGFSFWADLEANQDTTIVSAFAAELKLPYNTKISTGLFPRFIGADRKTEIYPMIGTAMWRYEQYQITLEGKIEPVYWGISYGEGLRLGTKQIGEDSSYKMVRDDRNAGTKTGAQELGLKLGVAPKIGPVDLDVLAYAFIGQLDSTDVAFLASNFPGYTSTDNTQTRYGGRVTFMVEGLTVMGEIAKFEDGTLDRDGWYAQASYKIKTGNKNYITSIEPLVRYGEMNVDWPQAVGSTTTWDRQSTVIALITELAKNVKLKAEYYMFDEDTGGSSVNNNEILVQLQYKF
ncbi:MAG: hypothetical protein ABIJ37_04880 [Pseudomonadota bacterium]